MGKEPIRVGLRGPFPMSIPKSQAQPSSDLSKNGAALQARPILPALPSWPYPTQEGGAKQATHVSRNTLGRSHVLPNPSHARH